MEQFVYAIFALFALWLLKLWFKGHPQTIRVTRVYEDQPIRTRYPENHHFLIFRHEVDYEESNSGRFKSLPP